MTETLFPLGQVLISASIVHKLVKQELCNRDIDQAIERHSSGDWGLLGEEDWEENDQSLKRGLRLLSSYQRNGIKFWVITEADRSITTVLLPSDY